MIAKLPIIAPGITCGDLLASILVRPRKEIISEFTLALSDFIPVKYIYLTNSGIASFYLILNALKEKSQKKEVILPAYTAGSLVVAVIKAGLKPVLCDISLVDFNLDREGLFKAFSPDTIAVTGVHMFGVPIQGIEELKQKIPPDIFLIEDCAQAMGSRAGDKRVGSFGNISFFSFNRGKNLPVCGGGCIATNNKEIATAVERTTTVLKNENFLSKLAILFRIFAFSLVANPLIYGLGYPFISLFKDTAPPKDFAVRKISKFQARLGAILLRKNEEFVQARYHNGMFLLHALENIEGITLPQINEDEYAAFNRLPILFKDLNKKEMAKKRLWKNGIETSRMYLKSLHYMFNLGYKKADFPNAVYFAEHLLTLPVHPLVKEEDLLKMIKIIKSV